VSLRHREEEPVVDKTPLLLEQALAKIGRLDYAGARPLLIEYLSKRPDRIDALEHLFNIDKQQPSDPAFHETSKQFLSALLINKSNGEKAWKVYAEYEKIIKNPGLPTDLQFRLSSIFCELAHSDEAQTIMESILRKKPDYPNIPTLIIRMIRMFEKTGSVDKAEHYRKLLSEKYQTSAEARILKG